jgi:hypothetical protein
MVSYRYFATRFFFIEDAKKTQYPLSSWYFFHCLSLHLMAVFWIIIADHCHTFHFQVIIPGPDSTLKLGQVK